MTTLQAEALLTRAAHDLTHTWNDPYTDDEGHMHALERDPWLKLLHDRIGSDIGGTTGGASTKHSRNLIDTKALDLENRIRNEANDLVNPVGITVGRNVRAGIDNMVTRAELLYQRHNMTEELYTALIDACHKWQRLIQSMLEPEETIPLPGTCPDCERAFKYTFDEDGQEIRSHALRRADGDLEAWCEVCGQQWIGLTDYLNCINQLGYRPTETQLAAMLGNATGS